MELNFYLIILPLVPLNQLITLPTHGNLKIPLPTQTILPPPPAIQSPDYSENYFLRILLFSTSSFFWVHNILWLSAIIS